MSSLSPAGSDTNIPPPPQQPGVPTTQPDRGAGPALAGFLCGLVSFSALVVGVLVIGGAVPGVTGDAIGAGVVLIVAAFPVALVGLILSIRGRHSLSRRWLAIAGMVLSVLVLVLSLLVTVWLAAFWASWSNCSHNQATGSCF